MQSETLSDNARALVSALDDLLKAVEKSAWSARAIYDDVRGAFEQLPSGRSRRRRRHHRTDTRAQASELSGAAGVGRLVRTGMTLGQIAGSYRLHRLQSAFLPTRKASRKLERLHEDNAKRFYAACVEHGGAFVKVGQVLSARSDLLPKPFVTELSQLQDAVPAVGFEVLRPELERQLGRKLEAAFATFEPQALAAASIGQVHVATTHAGERVAVKARRPAIESLVRADLQLLETFLQGLGDSLPALDYDTIVAELKAAVIAELDYEEEARMTEVVRNALGPDGDVVVPRVYPDLSNAAVLTTQFIDGRKLTVVLDELAASGDRAELSRLLGVLLHAYLKQILTFGVFQADPHPGNLLVTRDGKLAILDFGCSKTLSAESRNAYVGLLRTFVSGERERMGELLLQIGFRTESGKPDSLLIFADALLAEFREALAHGSFVWPDREQMLERATRMLRASQTDPVTHIPADFVLIARVLGTLGGLFSHYRPDIAFAEHVLPVLGEVLMGGEAQAA